MGGPKELELFLEDPEKYAPLEPRKLPPPPNRRPHRRTAAEAKAMAPKPVEFAGYCPVTYLDGGKRFADETVAQFLIDLSRSDTNVWFWANRTSPWSIAINFTFFSTKKREKNS